MPADHAFAVAADVGAYKNFVPLVTRSTVSSEKVKTGSIVRFSADLQIAVQRLGLAEAFTSDVETNATTREVVATSSDGPMKRLKCVWVIATAEANSSKITVTIDYVFKNMLFQIAAASMMDRAVQKILASFEKRAVELYHHRSS